jgi:hypothetical protein
MYPINPFSMQEALATFIAADRFRTGQNLVGTKNHINTTFLIPDGKKFVHELPHLTICVFYNGVRQEFLEDYLVFESGGVGTGFDAVTLFRAPYSDDSLQADYVIVGS